MEGERTGEGRKPHSLKRVVEVKGGKQDSCLRQVQGEVVGPEVRKEKARLVAQQLMRSEFSLLLVPVHSTPHSLPATLTERFSQYICSSGLI